MAFPLRIDLVSDVVCPWCAIGLARLEQAMQELADVELVLHWHPFLLNPDIGPEGREMSAHLGAKYGKSPAEIEASQRDIISTAEALGLDFSGAMTRRSWNTLTTHRILHYAREHGRDDALNRALLQAYFGQGANLTDPALLQDLARGVGLDGEAVADILASDRYREAVQDEVAELQQLGISAVPSFLVAERYLISGAQPPDMLADTLSLIVDELTAGDRPGASG